MPHRPLTTTDDTRDASTSNAAASAGTIAGVIGAVPVVGPALLTGCLSCVGSGAAAGLGTTSALPPT